MQQWQSTPASTLNPWFSMAPCWSELAVSALQFLAGESKCKVYGLFKVNDTCWCFGLYLILLSLFSWGDVTTHWLYTFSGI